MVMTMMLQFFGSSAISKMLGNNLIHVPDDELINEVKLPYTLVGDDIFPLKTWLIKPYPGKNLTVPQ